MLALRTPTPGYADWLRLRILLTKCSRPNNKIHNKYWNFILYTVVIFLSVKEARVWMIYHKYEVKCKVFIFIMDSSKEMSPYIASQSVPRRQQQLCKVRRGELRWGLRLSGWRGEWGGLHRLDRARLQLSHCWNLLRPTLTVASRSSNTSSRQHEPS